MALSLRKLAAHSNFCFLQIRHRSKYLITTPIFYVNAAPHIGHLYSAVIADAGHRLQLLLGNQSVLSTGTDEHGTKIQQAADFLNIPLPTYCDSASSKFKHVFEQYGINYTHFIRTTHSDHKDSVKHFWKDLVSKGAIYSGNYSGWYCDADEAFLTESQVTTLVKGGKEIKVCAESARPVHWVEEQNYKFKLLNYKDEVLHWLKSDDSVQPEKFKKQLLAWINEGLMENDVSVSRPSSRVHWGIHVPGDESQTIYVWLDALVNYLTISGYPNLVDWPPSVQVIGKDILKFHGIYWPAFLIASKLEPPSTLFVHSHWTVDGEKMSKSLGNVVCPLEAANRYTAEGLRYFLLREGTPHSDSNFSETKVSRILNAELADTLGNLLNRCTAKSINVQQVFPEFCPEHYERYCKEIGADLILGVSTLRDEVTQHFLDFNFYRGISIIISNLHAANRFFELNKPWELRKSNDAKNHLDCVLHITMECLRVCGIALQPIVPQLSTILLDKLAIPTSCRKWTDLTPSWVSNSSQAAPLNVEKSGNIHVFELIQKKLHNYKEVFSLEVFSSQNIYGIVPREDQVLVFGGKQVSVLLWSSKNHRSLSIKTSWEAEDWILDGLWSENSVILLTAHNAILEYIFFPVCKLISKLVSVECCILYSGKILGSKLEDIVIIAGTVYQEVIVWATPDHGQTVDIPVLQRLQGHKGVIFCTAYDEETQCIASTSDDRTVRVWSVKFPEESASVSTKWAGAEIYLSFTAFGHTARVWRCLFTPSGDLATVGEDYNICLWDKKGILLNKWEHSGEIWCVDYHNDCIAVGGNGVTVRSLSAPPKVVDSSISDFGAPRRAVLSFLGNPVISSDEGFLIQLKNNTPSCYVHDKKFLSYCCLSISPCRSFVILGGINGELVLYKVNENDFCKLLEMNVDEGKIYSLTWTSEESFVCCGDQGCLSVFKIVKNNDEYDVTVTHKYTLPLSKERWTTCGLIVESFFICGDRMGSLHLYTLVSDNKEPLHSFLKLHGLKGVTDIKYLNGLLTSVGRDGTLKELEIIDNSLHLNSTLKLPMNWATSIIHSQLYGLLVAGFHDASFVLWSIDERITLLALECGGGHRSFDFFIDELNRNLVLTYIRMKDIKFMCSPFEKLAHSTILKSYHVKSINTACLLNFDNNVASVLTGGEDNSLRLCRFDRQSWQGYGAYVRHISAVRAVKSAENVYVSAGCRAQIIVWEVNANSHGELRLRELKSHMIREETAYRKSWKDAEPLVDPETRYMDLEIYKNEDSTFTILAACSDGKLRIFDCDTTLRKLELRSSIDSDQGCLLKLSKFCWNNIVGVVSGGTKGTVAFWYPPYQGGQNSTHSIHSMGINAMDLFIVGENIVLATGGDDSSVTFTLFFLSQSKTETVVFNIVEHVHTCQITGIKMTPDFAVSASVDQKICLFNWKQEGHFLKTSLLTYYLTSVPDIHGILSWEENDEQKKDFYILVFGCGFQLLHLRGPLNFF